MVRRARTVSLPAVRAALYLVRPLRDVAAIRECLRADGAYATYALAQLAPRYFPLVSCWEASGPAGRALVLFSRGGLGDAVYMSGEPAALAAILALHQGPRHNFATCREAHLPVVERYYKVANPRPMLRMVVDRDSFRPPPAPRSGVTVRRMMSADARLVNRLYSSEGQPAFYSAGHIEQGMYHGVFAGRRLVAVAGTHVIAPEEGVAVVGNVFTHPDHRGRGYGTLVTGVTTAALLQSCHTVALTVDPTNEPAVRAYRRLGYREESRLVESPITRRSLTGLAPLLSAALAAWRGRHEGGELVDVPLA